MLLYGVGYLGLFGLRLLGGPWSVQGCLLKLRTWRKISGGCSSHHEEGVCLVSAFGESRVRAYVGEEAAGFVPEEAGAPGVRSIPGKGVYTWKGGIRNRYYGICV